VKEIKTELRLQLGRGGGATHDWSFSINDARSGQQVIRLFLSDADMGALLGCTGVALEGLVMTSDRIGKRMEVVTRRVPMAEGHSKYEPELWRYAVLMWAADNGLADWTPDIDQRFNSHRHGGGTYEVTFRRWVEA